MFIARVCHVNLYVSSVLLVLRITFKQNGEGSLIRLIRFAENRGGVRPCNRAANVETAVVVLHRYIHT